MFYLKNKIIEIDKIENIKGKDLIHSIRSILQYMDCIYKEEDSYSTVKFRIPIIDTTIDWWFIPKDMYNKLPIEESYKINYTGRICYTGDTSGINLTNNEEFLKLFNTRDFISVRNTLGSEYERYCNRLLNINLEAQCTTLKFNTNCDICKTAVSYYDFNDNFSIDNYNETIDNLDSFNIKYNCFEIDDSESDKLNVCAVYYLEFNSDIYCFNKNIENISNMSCTVIYIKLLISTGALIKLNSSAIELIDHILSISKQFNGIVTSAEDYDTYCNN